MVRDHDFNVSKQVPVRESNVIREEYVRRPQVGQDCKMFNFLYPLGEAAVSN